MFERFQVASAQNVIDSHISQLFPPNVGDSLKALLTSPQGTAQTAVIESDYIDVDYSASYYDQRGRSFTPDKRTTTRIHFFSDKFSKRSLTTASRGAIAKMQRSYLGFAVLRPERPTTLGRSVLTCPTTISGQQVRFPTRGNTPVDLAGIPLQVASCPYLSQDTKIMACATAAIWMSTSNLVQKIPGVASHTTAEITSMAMSLNRPFGPVVGRRGLSIIEMEQSPAADRVRPQETYVPYSRAGPRNLPSLLRQWPPSSSRHRVRGHRACRNSHRVHTGSCHRA